MNKIELYNYLESEGFKQIEQDKSAYFNDYLDIFDCVHFRLRFSSNRSFETVDINSTFDEKNIYDFGLVMALLINEKNLNKKISINESYDFLKEELKKVKKLFTYDNYLSTKKKLDDLENERVLQMFPNLK